MSSELGEVWLNMRDYLFQISLVISISLCLLSVYFFPFEDYRQHPHAALRVCRVLSTCIPGAAYHP